MSINIKNVPVPYLRVKGNNGSTFFLRDGFVLLEPDILEEAYIVVDGTDTYILNTNVDQPYLQEAFTIEDLTNTPIANVNVDQGFIQEFKTALLLNEFYICWDFEDDPRGPILTEDHTIVDGALVLNPTADSPLLTGEFIYDTIS